MNSDNRKPFTQKTRKDHICNHCKGVIVKGGPADRENSRTKSGLVSHTYHVACFRELKEARV